MYVYIYIYIYKRPKCARDEIIIHHTMHGNPEDWAHVTNKYFSGGLM
jgi:hypothetical protein